MKTDMKEEILKEQRELIHQYNGLQINNPIPCISSDMEQSLQDHLREALDQAIKEAREEMGTGETSDGYHTFNELYEFRKIFNAALFNEWQKQGKYMVHKSKKHSDGELCFGGGWFIVMAQLPTGQISNHYELKDWDLFQVDELEKSAKWDGHTAQDVAVRLREYLEFKNTEGKEG